MITEPFVGVGLAEGLRIIGQLTVDRAEAWKAGRYTEVRLTTLFPHTPGAQATPSPVFPKSPQSKKESTGLVLPFKPQFVASLSQFPTFSPVLDSPSTHSRPGKWEFTICGNNYTTHEGEEVEIHITPLQIWLASDYNISRLKVPYSPKLVIDFNLILSCQTFFSLRTITTLNV